MSNRAEAPGAPAGAGARRAAVGYLGPAGTFSEQALLASADVDAVAPLALASIYDTIAALRRGEVSWAIVPIENSLEGSINVTLDLLADEARDLRIVGEALLRVEHALIAAAPTELAQIDTVLTHPHVPGQCTRFLRSELAHARIVPASSTAEAVRAVTADARRGQAAIGTALAASIYGATVIRARVEDRDDNETRFVWLARAQKTTTDAPASGYTGGALAPAPPLRVGTGGQWKTSLVFWGAGAEHAGWLVRCLDTFARRAINLTKIESRPRRQGLGSYMFFADLAATASDAPVLEALAELQAMCEEVRVLGCYRAAAPLPAGPTPAPEPTSATASARPA
jgi:prephenate dehydratase